ncbi:MAG: signal peptidase I [Actinomycetota bacterium]|mgnify:CR=1 FL=1|nr:signal peptidase I [Actinomycetota bacterium]
MESEQNDDDPVESFSDTEKWAKEVLERARTRSMESDSIEDQPSTQVAESTEVPESNYESVSLRESIVTLEDIGGEDMLHPATPDFESSDPNENDLFSSFGKKTRKSILEWVVVIVGAVGLALLIKAFLFQAYYIPSPSMNPTLFEGDRILVNKLSYKLHSVNRGDLIVFDTPEASGEDDLIKRVIGLPGEFVNVEEERIEIDGGLLLEPYLPLSSNIKSFATPVNCVNRPNENYGCRIPDDHVFVMGDNRSNSRDSRFFGPVPIEDVKGRAFIRVWPIGDIKRL